MAEEKKAIVVKKSTHIVLKDFTADKHYRMGDTFDIAEGKTKIFLITNKYIK